MWQFMIELFTNGGFGLNTAILTSFIFLFLL